MIICGRQKIDINDWRAHTDYKGGYQETDMIIKWFWEIV